jgi:hypothetical protein
MEDEMITTIICSILYVIGGCATISGIVRVNGCNGIKGMIDLYTEKFGIAFGTITPIILILLWPLVALFFAITFIGGLIYGLIITIFKK